MQAQQETEWVGKPLDRVDGRAKVTGAAKYAADFQVPNVAFAWLGPSTIARGEVASIDAAAAQKLPGVIAILTHENMPKLHPVTMEHQLGKPGQTFLPLQGAEIHY